MDVHAQKQEEQAVLFIVTYKAQGQDRRQEVFEHMKLVMDHINEVRAKFGGFDEIPRTTAVRKLEHQKQKGA